VLTKSDNRSTRRGSIYILTLGTALLVTVIGMSVLVATRTHHRIAQDESQIVAARRVADAGIDVALYFVQYWPYWRIGLDEGLWFEEFPAGTGHFSLEVTDPQDGDISDAVCDNLRFYATGVVDGARQMVQVDLRPDAADYDDPYPPLLMSLNPLGYWRLGEATGSTAFDERGTNDGTYRKGVTLAQPVPYRCDTAAYFDGSNDFVEIPHVEDYAVRDGSVQLWVRIHSSGGIFSKDSSGYDDGGHLHIGADNGRIQVRLQRVGTSYYVRSSSIGYGVWRHVVFTFGRAGMRLYIDGVQVDSEWWTGGLDESSGGAGNAEPIALGVSTRLSSDETTDGWNDPFRGYIDEVAFFDYQLTDSQIYDLYVAASELPPHTVTFIPGTWQRVVD
jgi:hypothetical protein